MAEFLKIALLNLCSSKDCINVTVCETVTEVTCRGRTFWYENWSRRWHI